MVASAYDSSGILVSTTVTDSNGNYQFAGLLPVLGCRIGLKCPMLLANGWTFLVNPVPHKSQIGYLLAVSNMSATVSSCEVPKGKSKADIL